MESLFDIQEKLNHEIDSYITRTMTFVGAAELGLDPRCGHLHVSDEAIAVQKAGSSILEYYGGFEYIPDAYVKELGDYTFYLTDHDRVQECLEYYREMQTMKLDEVVAENDYMD